MSGPFWIRRAGRALAWVLAAAVALQLFFLLRIVGLVVFNPTSTAFQRSEAWRIASESRDGRWSQRWVPLSAISTHLQRAVIASEDAGFATHDGVDWAALRSAWERNERRQAQAQRRGAESPAHVRRVKLVGGSTITQQLAKNLLLSGERTLLRKGQELVLTLMLEAVLDKRRLLEIYLNSVEWGEGVFGAEAAAQRYFGKPASRLSAAEAARLAVMLPSPKFFEKRPSSAYLAGRAATIAARMGDVRLP